MAGTLDGRRRRLLRLAAAPSTASPRIPASRPRQPPRHQHHHQPGTGAWRNGRSSSPTYDPDTGDTLRHADASLDWLHRSLSSGSATLNAGPDFGLGTSAAVDEITLWGDALTGPSRSPAWTTPAASLSAGCPTSTRTATRFGCRAGPTLEHGGAPNPPRAPTTGSVRLHGRHQRQRLALRSPLRSRRVERRLTRTVRRSFPHLDEGAVPPPFRIQRRWELEAGEPDRQDACLPDDRGLTAYAKNGVLHVTDACVSTLLAAPAGHNKSWAASTRIPVRRSTPSCSTDTEPEGAIASGQLLPGVQDQERLHRRTSRTRIRRGTGPPKSASVSQHGCSIFRRPSPGLPVRRPRQPVPWLPRRWASRPLTKPPPYPKLSPTETMNLALIESGIARLGLPDRTEATTGKQAPTSRSKRGRTPRGLAVHDRQLPELRRPQTAQTPYANRTCRITYFYDPETIDHTTGRLL